jgi:hypothetical protein
MNSRERPKENLVGLVKSLYIHRYEPILCGHKYHGGRWGEEAILGSSWLNGEKPKGIAPLVSMSSKRKSWNVKAALIDNEWV